MPTRNIIKHYGENTYYHVYNRGVNKEGIFREDADYVFFLGLLKRHLSPNQATTKYGRPAPNYAQDIDLVAYCLMPNHYHLLVLLKQTEGLEKLMRSAMTTYSMYFNRKYGRVGSLFQNHFLAAAIDSDSYLWQVSRYIHLNPLDIGKDVFTYPYSSIDYFVSGKHADWLHPEHLIKKSEDPRYYREFVADYKAAHQELADLKHQLAA